jgi:N-acetylglucosamine-6-sulfatase
MQWGKRVTGRIAGVAAAAVLTVLSGFPPPNAGGGSLQAERAVSRPHRSFNNVDGKPNVILFLTDDQALSDMRALPAVRRRIGEPGTRFSRAFSQYPLCCPARATLLTGQYAHNHGVMGNVPPFGGFPAFDDRETLPVWLQRAGYNTLMLGKYLNEYDKPETRGYLPPGWTQWQVPVVGVYNYRSFTMNENGRFIRYKQDPLEHAAARGSRLIRRYAASEKPFFLHAGFVAPHSGGPIEPDDPLAVLGNHAFRTPAVAPEFHDAYRHLDLPSKPSIFEDDLTDKPGLARVYHRPRWEFREVYQQRLESLLSVNKAVDRMLDALRATGEARETLVIFTSDNGYLVGEHRSIGKTVGYEESVRVPLYIKGPGFTPGVSRDQLVTLADLTSTITEAAGATTTLLQDGRPLQPLSRDPAVAADRPVLLEAGPTRATAGRRLYTAIRTPDDRTLIRWHTGDLEYYNLREDPYQLDGGISGTETPEERDELMTRLRALRACAGATCR